MDSTSSNIVTVPLDSVLTDAAEGSQIVITQWNTGQTTIAAAVGVTIYSEGNKYAMRGQYAVASLIKVGANSWLLSGNLVT
jgi:hypothetical protein